MIDVHCDVPGCGLPMAMPGAVVISPPLPNDSGRTLVVKYHICALCWARRFRKMFEDEFRCDAAAWPHLEPNYPEDPPRVEFFRVAEKRYVPRYVKDPSVEGVPSDIDVSKILGKALWNKVQEDMEEYFAGLTDNQLVQPYCFTEEEIDAFMQEHDEFWSKKKKTHPIWELIKRGWF